MLPRQPCLRGPIKKKIEQNTKGLVCDGYRTTGTAWHRACRRIRVWLAACTVQRAGWERDCWGDVQRSFGVYRHIAASSLNSLAVVQKGRVRKGRRRNVRHARQRVIVHFRAVAWQSCIVSWFSLLSKLPGAGVGRWSALGPRGLRRMQSRGSLGGARARKIRQKSIKADQVVV